MSSDPIIVAAIISTAGVIASALFAWISGVYSTRVAKQNAAMQARVSQQLKLAEFRQIWINDLRNGFVNFSHSLHNTDPKTYRREVTASIIKLLLLMNKKDADYKKLRNYIVEAMEASVKTSSEGTYLELIDLAQDILKREWEVTKNKISLLNEPN